MHTSTILTILFILIGFGLGTLFGVALEDRNQILAVLTVIGTVGAVIWAVSRDTIFKYINRPILKVDFYETYAPYLRYVPPDQDQEPHQYILTLSISNIGKTVAESCQPLITKLWIKGDKDWIAPSGWVPLPLNWVFLSELEQEYLREINIYPNKPYLFNICTIFDTNTFLLTAPIRSRSQPTYFRRWTTYCIELTAFSVNAKPITKNYYINWKGPYQETLAGFKSNIEIYESKKHPYPYHYEDIKSSKLHEALWVKDGVNTKVGE